jgi:hypothetical protein
VSGEITKADINNGKSSMLIKLTQFNQRVLTKTLDSMSTDHSTLCLNFHSEE